MDKSRHNDFIFCYWDDLGDSHDHVDSRVNNPFNYFNHHAASARSKDNENGMAILHEQSEKTEDRSTTEGGCITLRELREHKGSTAGSETQGENDPSNDCQV